ncbi:MAG: tetratricopeptide repeat protein [Pseudonocardiaceae bacterium]
MPLLADCYQQRERETAGLDEAVSTGTVVLSGLGGVGKTQLAADYARRIWAQHGAELLVWATGNSRAAVQVTYAQAAAEIGHLPAQDVERAAEWFLGWLQNTNRAWLVVLDDVVDPGDLRCLWPTGSCGRTVVTTRRRDAVLTDRGRRLIDIGLYTASEAVAYLQDKLSGRCIGVMAEAAELAHDLDRLPLALAQAATFIRDRGESCAGYRRRLTNLHRLNLISVDPAGGARAIRTHALVQRATLEGLPTDVVSTTVRAAADALVLVWPEIERDTDLGRVLRDCVASLRARHGGLLWDPDGHAVLFRAGRSLGECGLFGAAVGYWTHLATEAGATLGPDHTHTLTTRHRVAYWRGEAGDPAGAAAAFEQLLTDCVRVLGADHPDTLGTRHNIAYWRGVAGDPVDAAAAFEQLLTDCVRVLGADHPDTLGTHRSAAYWRGAAGDPAGAVAAFEQLPTDCERVLGADHADTLGTRRDLARLRGQAGDPAGAVAAFEQLLTAYLRVLGPDHPDTLTVRGDFAHWQGKAGDPTGAAAAYEQLLTDRLRVLGADHHHTLGTRRALALRRGQSGDPVGAVAALEQLLTDYVRVLGPDRFDTLRIRHDLAHWRGEAGRAMPNGL